MHTWTSHQHLLDHHGWAGNAGVTEKLCVRWYILRKVTAPYRIENPMAAKKKAASKVEVYATKALMMKHENSEGKKMAMMEKKMGEKNVVAKIKSSMKSKSARKKTTESI